ncbi:MAG: glycosyltransferase family 2 protein [Herpetosiphon sp.]
MIDVAIIIVSYNVATLLVACLHSLEQTLAAEQIDYRIVVVDNASTDQTRAVVSLQFPSVTLIASPVNVGFAGGNNLALRHLGFGTNAPDLPRSVLLLNADTLVFPGTIARLLHLLQQRPDVAVVGPLLHYPDGTIQSSRRRFPTPLTLFWESTLLEQWWPSNPWAHRYHMSGTLPTDEQTVDWLVGAALLVRGEAIQRAGLLDAGFFMYSEELEWQQRIRRVTGCDIVYLPTAIVLHYEGKSSEQNLGQRHINFARSRVRYARQHFGPFPAALLRRFLWLTFLLQAAVEATKWLVGHKRCLRQARITQYRQVLSALAHLEPGTA